MRRRRAEAGFTLVELLITMALLSLLIGYCLSALYVWQKMDAAAARNEAQENVGIIAEFLRTSFEEALPGSILDSVQQRKVIFEGGPDRIKFLTLSPGLTEFGGVYQVSIWREADGRLLLTRSLFQQGSTDALPPKLLLTGVRSIAFSYVYCRKDNEGVARPPDAGEQGLPLEMTLDVKFETGDRRQWPGLVAMVGAVTCDRPQY